MTDNDSWTDLETEVLIKKEDTIKISKTQESQTRINTLSNPKKSFIYVILKDDHIIGYTTTYKKALLELENQRFKIFLEYLTSDNSTNFTFENDLMIITVFHKNFLFCIDREVCRLEIIKTSAV